MKLERQDTEPLSEEAEGFSSLLRNGTLPNISLSHINTSELNELQQLVGISNNVNNTQNNTNNPQNNINNQQTVQNTNINHTTEHSQNTIVISNPQDLEFGNNFDQLFNIDEGEALINWSGEDVDFSQYPESTLNQVHQIVRGLTLPPSTSTAPQDGLNQEINSTVPLTLSLNSWPGNYQFNISIFTDTKDRNKVAYSEKLNKLFVCPNYIVPVAVSCLDWTDITLSAMAVYKQKQHQKKPVTRCYNCKSSLKFDDYKHEHYIHIEDSSAVYEIVDGHYTTTVPMPEPSPGETSTTILIKCTCLNSCVGGPCRRPTSILFTLKSRGIEVGRQIIELKCCRCPGRDKDNEEKDNGGNPNKVKKIKISDACTSNGSSKRKIETDDSKYVIIKVRKEFESQVKKYINKLECEKYVKKHCSKVLPFPEESSE